jgi:hypothetical protein
MDHLTRLLSDHAVTMRAKRADLSPQKLLAGRLVRLVTTRATLVNRSVSVRRFGGGVVVAFEAELELRAC